MNKILSVAAVIGLLAAGCSKSSTTVAPPSSTTTGSTGTTGGTTTGGTTAGGTATTSNKITIGSTDYTTVVIGTQTWTAVNYNGDGGKNFGNQTANDPSVGKLYTLAEAKAVVLPSGWRLPTKADMEALLKSQGKVTTDAFNQVSLELAGARHLRSKTGWVFTSGDNTSGFNAIGTGLGLTTNTGWDELQVSTHFWTSTSAASGSYPNAQYVLEMIAGNLSIDATKPTVPTEETTISSESYGDRFRYSIRFVKDN